MARIFTAVAIPARNEAERIGACLEALDQQDGAQLDAIVLLVNNTTDRTADLARGLRLRTRLHVVERTLPPAEATAGHARRLAMEAAADLAGPDSVLLTTDADGLVDPTWLAANLTAIAAGADAVCGWVELHPTEWGQIPARLHEDDARECAYDALLDEIHARLDPDPADPIPRHTQQPGASIALTEAAYRRCGGVPAIPSGEDRALIAALRRVDASVRHAPEVHLTVSGRTAGRSKGGMAETILRRLSRPDPFLDDRLEPAHICALRAESRAALRPLWTVTRVGDSVPPEAASSLAARLGLQPALLLAALHCRYFGEAWEAVTRASPALRPRLVPVSELAGETATARAIVEALRRRITPARAHPGGRSDTAPPAAAWSE